MCRLKISLFVHFLLFSLSVMSLGNLGCGDGSDLVSDATGSPYGDGSGSLPDGNQATMAFPDVGGDPDNPGLCSSDCLNKECGDDGCGNLCGVCALGEECVSSLCQPVGAGTEAGEGGEDCTPDCLNKDCGEDGCGGSCGECPVGWQCEDGGACLQDCVPDCFGKNCGDDGCGGSCGSCPGGSSCQFGVCISDCNPNCAGKQCGPDGCDGTCGACGGNNYCDKGACVPNCNPDCAGKQCGMDGCGGICGTCGGNDSCINNQCVSPCNPDCGGKSCGEDGCGGSCGSCSDGMTCNGGSCGFDVPIETLYRFYKESGGDNIDIMFSAASSVPDYSKETAHFDVYTQPASGLIPIYQTYCDSCMDHLQSTTSNEHPLYIAQEILGYCTPDQTSATPNALYRVYGADWSNHFVTTSYGEVQSVIDNLGYVLEFTLCYVP